MNTGWKSPLVTRNDHESGRFVFLDLFNEYFSTISLCREFGPVVHLVRTPPLTSGEAGSTPAGSTARQNFP